ncbi:MAG: NADPH-dependent F420 reductase [Haloarculaceae archaeon]
MDVSLLGGTGDIGAALALRWARDTDHTVVVGSRDAGRARERAADYERELAARGAAGDVTGCGNREAADRGDVVVCTVPPYHLTDTIESVSDVLDADTVLVSPAVGMKHDEDGAHYNRPAAGSVAALADRAAPADTPVVGAYHNLPAAPLADLDTDVEAETPVVGDDETAVERVVDLTNAVEGLQARRAGGLANAAEVEALAPLLINVGEYDDDLDDVWISFG